MTTIHLLLLRMSGKIRRGLISLTRYNEILGEFAFRVYSWCRFDQIRQHRLGTIRAAALHPWPSPDDSLFVEQSADYEPRDTVTISS